NLRAARLVRARAPALPVKRNPRFEIEPLQEEKKFTAWVASKSPPMPADGLHLPHSLRWWHPFPTLAPSSSNFQSLPFGSPYAAMRFDRQTKLAIAQADPHTPLPRSNCVARRSFAGSAH